MNEKLQQKNQELTDQIVILIQQLDRLKRQPFGHKGKQLKHPDLFTVQESDNPDSSGDTAAPEERAKSSADAESEKRARNIRKDRLPENLPVRTEEITPEIVWANPKDWRSCDFEEMTSSKKNTPTSICAESCA
jgi:hypothetical protein